MAKVLFLQNLPFEYMGPMSISALLKKHGHDCRLFVLSEHRNYLQELRDFNPDLIGFSTMTGPHKWVLNVASEIKNHIHKPILLGGPHPTFFPEVIQEPCVDMICLGEGEFTVLEIAEKLDKSEDISHIKNFWIKRDGRLFKNDLRFLVQDLDELPFPDRTLYDDCRILRSVPAMKFLTGRGCPYRCSFCFNHKFNQLYRGLGRVVRKRGVDSLIQEIKETAEKYRLKLIRFPDDTFTGNRRWLLEFLPKYKQEINLPFTALAHAHELDEEVVHALKSSGCLNIYFGVETGDQDLRNRILKKNLTNRKLIDTARILRRHRLKFGTYNMFGLPHETLATAFETVHLNRRLKPDYTINNIFQPYPKTEIADYAAEHGFLDREVEYLDTMNEGSVLQIEDIDRIVNLSRFAYLAIKFPFLMPFIKVLIKLPPNRLFKMVFDLTSAPAMKSNLNLNLIHLLRWGLQLRKIT
ncbi:MAG: B12-binding domain-containing radical SAM protein [Candidatus Aminicenantes bacterium]